jgi:hypothetical protein
MIFLGGDCFLVRKSAGPLQYCAHFRPLKVGLLQPPATAASPHYRDAMCVMVRYRFDNEASIGTFKVEGIGV